MRAVAFVVGSALAVTATSALERKVDVGGFKLNLRCAGEGSPVVVLDSGAGDTSATWDWVIPEVKRFSTSPLVRPAWTASGRGTGGS